jgi:hypothetical protein
VSPDRNLDDERQVPFRQLRVWVVFRSERDINIRPSHSSSWLDSLSQIDLLLQLLPLRFGGDSHATFEDHADFSHMLIIIGIFLVMIASLGLLWCRWCWWWHPFAIQKSFTLFQIMSCCAVNFTPLFYIIQSSERFSLFLIRGLFSMESLIPAVFPISPFSSIDLLIVLPSCWLLAT